MRKEKPRVILIDGSRKRAPNGYISCEGNKYVRADCVETIGGINYDVEDCVTNYDGNRIYKHDINFVWDTFLQVYIKRKVTSVIVNKVDKNGKVTKLSHSADENRCNHEKVAVKVIANSVEERKEFLKGLGIPEEDLKKRMGNVPSVLYFDSIDLAIRTGAKESYKSGRLYIGNEELIDRHLKGDSYSKYITFKNHSNAPDCSYSPSFIKTGGLRYSFGVELETSAGVVPSYIRPLLNISCVRDGSIEGGEYVSGVLRGTRGVNHLKLICDQLSKRCKTDDRTGVHIHIGDANFNKEFSIYAVILAKLIEDDLFKCLPRNRRENVFCEKLGLDDTFEAYQELFRKTDPKHLSKLQYKEFIENEFNSLFVKFSRGKFASGDYNRKKTHPLNRYAGGSGSGSFRYKWINFIPCNFLRIRSSGGEQDYTIEFRCLEGTTNFSIIYGWLLICMAFVSCVESHKSKIIDYVIQNKKMTLKELVSIVYDRVLLMDKSNLSTKLHEYIDYRMDTYNEEGSSSESPSFNSIIRDYSESGISRFTSAIDSITEAMVNVDTITYNSLVSTSELEQ